MDEGEAGLGGSGGGVGGGCYRGGGVLGQTTFTDVPQEHPQRVDIEYAVAQNWFLGYTDGTFKPDRKITAEQITTVIQRAFPDGATRGDMAVFMRAGNQALKTAVITEGDDVAIAWGKVQNRWLDGNPIYNYDNGTSWRSSDDIRRYRISRVLTAIEDMEEAWAATAVLVEKKGTAAAAVAAEAARAASVAAADAYGALGVIIGNEIYRVDYGANSAGKVRGVFVASSSAALAMAEVAVDAEEVEDWQYISRKWTEAKGDNRYADDRAANAAARSQSVFASYW